MTELDTLLCDIRTYCRIADRSTGTVSRLLFGDGTRFDKLCNENVTVTARVQKRARKQLDDMMDRLAVDLRAA